jgi:ribosome modulation factor
VNPHNPPHPAARHPNDRNHLPQQRTACVWLFVFALHTGEAMSIKQRVPDHRYRKEEIEGAHAGKDARCPYGITDIGRRCAWLAGWHDEYGRKP